LRSHLEGRLEGVAGYPKLELARRAGVLLPAHTRVRYVDETVLSTAHGPEIAREIEILEGPSAGRRVFVPPEAARPHPE
jgi:hypothetical protein